MIVNEVPCEMYDYCGEQYFKADVLKKIERDFQEIHAHRKPASTEIRMPVEQFA